MNQNIVSRNDNISQDDSNNKMWQSQGQDQVYFDKEEQIYQLKKKLKIMKDAVLAEREQKNQLEKKIQELQQKNESLVTELEEKDQNYQKLRKELIQITEKLIEEKDLQKKSQMNGSLVNGGQYQQQFQQQYPQGQHQNNNEILNSLYSIMSLGFYNGGGGGQGNQQQQSEIHKEIVKEIKQNIEQPTEYEIEILQRKELQKQLEQAKSDKKAQEQIIYNQEIEIKELQRQMDKIKYEQILRNNYHQEQMEKQMKIEVQQKKEIKDISTKVQQHNLVLAQKDKEKKELEELIHNKNLEIEEQQKQNLLINMELTTVKNKIVTLLREKDVLNNKIYQCNALCYKNPNNNNNKNNTFQECLIVLRVDIRQKYFLKVETHQELQIIPLTVIIDFELNKTNSNQFQISYKNQNKQNEIILFQINEPNVFKNCCKAIKLFLKDFQTFQENHPNQQDSNSKNINAENNQNKSLLSSIQGFFAN